VGLLSTAEACSLLVSEGFWALVSVVGLFLSWSCLMVLEFFWGLVLVGLAYFTVFFE